MLLAQLPLTDAFFLQLGVLLALARLAGLGARRLGLPAVAGELCAGIIIGPSLLGSLQGGAAAKVSAWLSAPSPGLDAITELGLVLLLFVAGLELDLMVPRRTLRAGLLVSLVGWGLTLAFGYLLGGYIYYLIPGVTDGGQLVFRLVIGLALATTALPLVVRTLLDLNLLRTEIGMVIVSAAMVDDVLGWAGFSLVLGLAGTGVPGGASATGAGLLQTVAALGIFIGGLLWLGRPLLANVLAWAGRVWPKPGGVLALTLACCLAAAGATEAFGLHGIFGAFWLGAALAPMPELDVRMREILKQFVWHVFAPLFFIHLGLAVNFVEHFNLGIAALLLAGAIAGKTIGATLGAILAGQSCRPALGIGLAMNARGALEIAFCAVALQRNLINQDVFVALVLVSLISGLAVAAAARPLLRPTPELEAAGV